VRVPELLWRDLEKQPRGGPMMSERIARIEVARKRSRDRGGRSNAHLEDRELDECVAASPRALTLLGRAVDRMGLSARAARSLLRVARTIADLRGDDGVSDASIAEALRFRSNEGLP